MSLVYDMITVCACFVMYRVMLRGLFACVCDCGVCLPFLCVLFMTDCVMMYGVALPSECCLCLCVCFGVCVLCPRLIA